MKASRCCNKHICGENNEADTRDIPFIGKEKKSLNIKLNFYSTLPFLKKRKTFSFI